MDSRISRRRAAALSLALALAPPLSLLPLLAGCAKHEPPIGGSGFIEATSSVVSAETSGRMRALFVDEGDRIEAGAPIGIIDSTRARLELDRTRVLRRHAETAIDIARIGIQQAEQDYALAEKEWKRMASLAATGSVNQQQVDQAETRLQLAKLTRENAAAQQRAQEDELARIGIDQALLEEQLSYCYPRAPISGLVSDRFIDRGELAGPGSPLVEIARTDTVWVKVYLPAPDLTAVRLGGTAAVDTEDGRHRPLTGRVVWIADEAEFTPKNVQTAKARADLVYAVKVDVANESGILKIGMPVMVTFPR